MVNVESHLNRLLAYVQRRDYAGYDPYDALNSPFLEVLSARSKWLRIVFTQLLRRFPLNLRPVLLISKGHNPKGLGLFLEGYSRLYKVKQEPATLNRIKNLMRVLCENRSTGYSGFCWGYNFPWQSRTVYRPRYTPTIVNTSFIGHALLDAYESTGIDTALDMAVRTKGFILRDLNRKRDADTFCFSYTPFDHDYVHNANALGASLLFRIGELTGDARLKEISFASMGYCLAHQRDDGAWPYAETKIQSWVDSFHTGFVLESLRRFLPHHNSPDWRRQYERGVMYYAENFFLEDGTPKYYSDRTYPIDIHSPAEAVCFFSTEGEEYRCLTDKILLWMLKNMWGGNGTFYYRKNRFTRTKVVYMRWSLAWAFRALTTYHVACQKGVGDKNGHQFPELSSPARALAEPPLSGMRT
ncbi:MAG: hypothetical protein JSU70_00355 [Phycisphaerales bacterium]|nr:MAG: hypothetical protein JSU70_00355 [Phycisphaerales bacterium]